MRSRTIVPLVVEQHAEDAAILHSTRTALTRAPHVKLHNLRRFDDRLAAHLDGLSIAGEHAWPLLAAMLERPSPGRVFAAAIGALEDGDTDHLNHLLALTAAIPESRVGLSSALGWVRPQQLSGLVAGMLRSEDSVRRCVGIAASAMHRVDPGLVSFRFLEDQNSYVRARGLRAAGELGNAELVSLCVTAISDNDPDCQSWAAWSAVLLGSTGVVLEALTSMSSRDRPHRRRLFRLALQAMSTSATHNLLQSLALDPKDIRWLIEGTGIAGDPKYVPWLIAQMEDDAKARIAGEAFSLVTGADLAWLDLERKPPENFESGPNDDPNDANVAMDDDDGLPWPDVKMVEAWWPANSGRFQKGTRYFMGAPVTREHCIDVLKNGYQRQRILAAHYLCLLEPGTPLFNTSAPAWRQQKQLAQMK
jgi:uncharacterized protein (TIGR02270 family)